MNQIEVINKSESSSYNFSMETSVVPPSSSAIAIVGYAYRFPGDLADDAAFWDALKQKRDLITQVPSDRWAVDELQHVKRSEPGRSITFSAGVLSRIDEFDAGFFGISPREAAVLDPQQRLLLELAWESMEHARIPPSRLAGSNCAVYVGISGFDYGMRGLDDLAVMTPHSMTGNTLSIAANRISYVFDLHGPSLAVDTACSSSLVALHQACNSLRAEEVSAALVGGVNLLLHPHPFVGFTKASMLSEDGRCKPFDASGNGYVRSEGGAVLMLKTLDKAIADGDQVHAVILASGVNADGARKTGITIPSSEGQAELMREVLARSGLSAADVDFIEAHGTGTTVGDPIEAAAIAQVYGRQRSSPLPIGSVKANLGHLEPASGLAGLIKTILALKNRALPSALHLETPNPRIDFAALNLELITEYKMLDPHGDKPLVAGLNSFGFGGANAHVLLQEFRSQPAVTISSNKISLPPLFLSARTDAALRDLSQRYADFLKCKSEEDFYHIACATAFGRERMEKRLALRADSVELAINQLEKHAKGDASDVYIEDSLPEGGGVAFVYSGNGAQWVGMGQSLLSASARFAEILADLDTVMYPYVKFSLLEELRVSEEFARLDDTTVAQPLLFAIQVAITMMLREQGVIPVAVTGHSVGEIAAAWAAGAFDLKQAVRIISARSQAQGLMRGKGRMAAVSMSAQAVAALIDSMGDVLDVEIAGINSPGNVTLSGSLESLSRIKTLVEAKGIFFRLLELDYAFHSRQMDPVESELASLLGVLHPETTYQAQFVSTVTGDVLEGASLDADYWWKNVREPVCFAAAIDTLVAKGCRIFVEIGPHAILQRYISECLTFAEVKGRVIPTLRRYDDGVAKLNEAVLRVQLCEKQPDFHNHFPVPGIPVSLPLYPWQRERHWMPWTSEGLRSIARHRVHPLLGWRLMDAELAWENTLDPILLPWLADHKVGGAIVYPGSAYAEMAMAAAREHKGGSHFIVEPLDIVAPMVFDGQHARTLRFVFNLRDNTFQIKSRQRLSEDEWTLHAAGRLLDATGRLPAVHITGPAETATTHDRNTHYALATALGLDYGPAFQRLRQVRFEEDRLEADLVSSTQLELNGFLLHPAVLDVCFQALVNMVGNEAREAQGIALLPVKMGRIELCRQTEVVRFRALLRRRSTRSALVDFELFDASDALVASITGCRFRAAHLKFQVHQKIANWHVVPWLTPHPKDGHVTQISIAHSAARAREVFSDLASERQVWFKQILPLSEVLTLSFALEAFHRLAKDNPQGWPQVFNSPLATPYVRWLAELLRNEGVLQQEGDEWYLVTDTDLPPAKVLWQSLLRDMPDYLPHLTLLGRIGLRLPALLAGTNDVGSLLSELQSSPVAEVLYNDDPAYLGVCRALESVLANLATELPSSRRLRVLEFTNGCSELPKGLIRTLREDQFDYVLAHANDTLYARQLSEYHEHPNVIVTSFDADTLSLSNEQSLPDCYDVIIVRHALHRSHDARAVLQQLGSLLAIGGMLVLAERYPDWCANLLEGLNPAWWHVADGQAPRSSLHAPEAWSQVMADAGYDDIDIVIEPASEQLTEGAYLLLAQRAQTDQVDPAPLPPERWLLLNDSSSSKLTEQLYLQLEESGQQIIVRTEAIQEELGFDHIVHLQAWEETPEYASSAVSNLLSLVRQIVAMPGKIPRLWLVSRGGALLAGLPAGETPNPVQSALWGFARVVMNEYPQLRCTVIDLDGEVSADTPSRLARELLYPDGCDEIVLTGSARYCPVMQEAQYPTTMSSDSSHYRLDFFVPGQLRNLVWLPEIEHRLQDNEVEVETRATGLNFRDVMYLMGLLPDEAVEKGFAGASLGLEFSGVVRRIGANVTTLSPGDAVMGFGSSCFASHVVTHVQAIERLPDGWTFEAAATTPTVFLTVYYALKQLACLQAGERVLIHGGAGGVGIAAIQLARQLGAEIFVTAGSDEKRDFVALLGADHVFDSRSLSFADDVLAATAGEGVDVVLNSLAGEAMRRSLDVLKPFGRFLELGKRDFFENTPVGLRVFKDNISYFGIDADQLLTGRPAFAAQMFREVMALFHEQALAPLPYRTFPADRIVDAFRVMQQARHIGKIVVSQSAQRPALSMTTVSPMECHFDKRSSWLVTGGLAGFGLESARWLAERGVGTLMLVGRRGLDTPGACEAIAELEAMGVRVVARACDLTDTLAVASLFNEIEHTLPPLEGILHAAAVFDDKLIGNMDAQSIQSVLNAKLQSAWHLHQASAALPLKYFVLYSSVTTAIGNPGQANYVAANAALEGLVALRRHLGLPAVSVAWGPIGDAGYLNRHQAVKDGLEQRLGRAALSTKAALSQLDHALVTATGRFMPANFDWNVLANLLPSSKGSRFAILNRSRQDAGASGDLLDIRAMIDGKSSQEIVMIVRELVAQEVAKILCISPDRIEHNHSLHDLGMDSLMAVELAMGLEQRFGIQLPVMMLNDAPTVSNVTARIVDKLCGGDSVQQTASEPDLVTGLAGRHGEGLSQDDVHQLNEDARKLAQTGTRLIL
ncbi:type I polyketide synthase [Leeia oryzae]|uniref:type I polyketide synthase n=1 Tax=Leeia oryzae TaxID=356662 RepID=UPI0003A17050|nr:type I polyketide synthase [Leeia oryzae]